MPQHTRLLPDDDAERMLLAALDASGVVGTWTHDVWADRIVVSAPLARLLGLDPDPAAAGVPMAAFLAKTLDEDRLRLENALHAAIERGGPFEIAFRTVQGERWLVLRGRIDRDGSGRRGRGIAIDHTEERADLYRPGGHSQQAVNRMAEHAIALHDLAAGLHQPRLVSLLDSLMQEIGFTLAGHLRGGERRRSH